MIRKATAIALICLPAAALAERPRDPIPRNLPSALRGVWMADTAAGRGQCRRYLAAMQAGQRDRAGEQLVGATLISARVVHSYAEYGEGNFAAVQSLAATGTGRWRANVQVGFDAMPTAETQVPGRYQFRLRGKRLAMTVQTGDDRAASTQNLALCTARLPAGS